MAFQDAWTSETERFRKLHIPPSPGRGADPSACFNINSMMGKTLYRHEMLSKFSENSK
jgi:hypothetical protein